MKRIAILLLILLLLIGCVPTPTEEFIVSKADDLIEQKIGAAQAPKPDQTSSRTEETQAASVERTPQFFPEHWSEEPYAVNEWVSVNIDAEIVTKDDGLYPVYRTKSVEWNPEIAEELLTKAFGTPTAAYAYQQTKEEWEREFQMWLDYNAITQEWIDAGMPDDGGDHEDTALTAEELKEGSDFFMKMITEAPDVLETHLVSDYSDIRTASRTVFTMPDGGSLLVIQSGTGFSAGIGCGEQVILYGEKQHAFDVKNQGKMARLWKEATLSRENADVMLNEALQKFGFSGYFIAEAKKTCLLDFAAEQHRLICPGWAYSLKKDYGGYPHTLHSYGAIQWERAADISMEANEPIRPESLILFFNENGLQAITYECPKEIVQIENENVELLPFEEIKTRIQNALSASFPTERLQYLKEHNETKTMEVYRLLLTTHTVRVRNEDAFYEMPCWIVFFDDNPLSKSVRDDPLYHKDVLIINAIDGSVVME